MGMTLTLGLLLNPRLLPDIYLPSFVVYGSCLDSVGLCGLWLCLVLTTQGVPLAVPLGGGWLGLKGLPPAVGLCEVLLCERICCER